MLGALLAVREWLRAPAWAPRSLLELGRSPSPTAWLRDLFGGSKADGAGAVEAWSASPSDWALLAVSIFACMALDFFAFRSVQSSAPLGAQIDRDAAEASSRSADPAPEPEPESSESGASAGSKTKADLLVLLCWILCGMAFNGVIFWKKGTEAGVQWCCGYFLEWLLSFDNIWGAGIEKGPGSLCSAPSASQSAGRCWCTLLLPTIFVFYLIFQTYKTPRELLHKALFIGIAGAIVLRIFFFVALSQLLQVVHWIRFVFGAVLVYSGVQAARQEDDDANPADSLAMKAFQAFFGDRVQSVYDIEGKHLFVTKGQITYATMLVPVIFCLEATDILFAIDSVSAKVAQIPDVYIAFSSSAMAMFGLRAMFFVVQDLVDMFDLLKYGLCFILVFIGVELIVSDFVQLPIQVVMAVIFSVFAVCICGPATKRMLVPAAGPSDAGLAPSG
ncbi:unnamed protein product [Prorocentrum cordatum]|uniref:Transmembrane protein 147 n=1 Tax=Prorocentrum cordatum TaxID=2364126 RepID=A0ABN9XRD6_9DINO|nr:unnamed protein product [Polarella glacialis]